jgi:hypothetical protein
MNALVRYGLQSAEDQAVAEVLGVEGPYTFPEKLLQQIWLRREFDQAGAQTTDGRKVRVVSPGRWNLLGGPDFMEARLEIGGAVHQGDVEVHLRVQDWVAHGHASDPAYDRVVLHVVLFPTTERATPGGGGRPIPILALLPLLYHDLEEYAADAAVSSLANRPSVRIIEALGGLSTQARRDLLKHQAERRWQQKVHFARVRLDKLGWDQACHQTILEILGYRYNRVAMLRVASLFPLRAWIDGGLDPDAVYGEIEESWALQGVRPANHPRNRLRQYGAWIRSIPSWPQTLERWGKSLPVLREGELDGTREVRRAFGMTKIRDDLATQVCAGALAGSRLDTVMCDGFLPLLAAAGVLKPEVGMQWWFHWFEGDVPDYIHRGLRDLAAIGERRAPACHGLAQGLLGWLLSRDSGS